MFSHITLGSDDLGRSEVFYKALAPTLGLSLLHADPGEGYLVVGQGGGLPPSLNVCLPFDDRPATAGNGFHVALMADGKEAVDRFHATALDQGGRDEGGPGLRSVYASDYYAAYIRDPDGNKLQAVWYEGGRKTGPTGDLISHITIGHGDFERERAFYSEEEIQASGRLLPWGRIGTPRDIGKAVAYLASDDADYVTGTILKVDGGYVAARSTVD